MQQRLQHDFTAPLGQALEKLVGTGDHHLALLDPPFADGGLLGQPLALGLHGVRFGRGLGPRLDLERRQQLLGVGEVVAREGGGGHRRGTHVGGLFAQRIDLGRQQAGLVGAPGDPVELARPQVDELGKRPLRRRRRLREHRSGGEQEDKPGKTGPDEAGRISHAVGGSRWLRRVFGFSTTADRAWAIAGNDGFALPRGRNQGIVRVRLTGRDRRGTLRAESAKQGGTTWRMARVG